jgi:hypothetical protein
VPKVPDDPSLASKQRRERLRTALPVGIAASIAVVAAPFLALATLSEVPGWLLPTVTTLVVLMSVAYYRWRKRRLGVQAPPPEVLGEARDSAAVRLRIDYRMAVVVAVFFAVLVAVNASMGATARRIVSIVVILVAVLIGGVRRYLRQRSEGDEGFDPS